MLRCAPAATVWHGMSCGRSCAPAVAHPSVQQTRQHRGSSRRAQAAAPGPGTGPLVDPAAAGRRLVVTPQQLDPSTLDYIRKAEAFGPRGLLLAGMSREDEEAIRSWFERMEPGFVVSCCPAALLTGGLLGQAVGASSVEGMSVTLPARAWEKQPPGTPPVAFFSGMGGEEQVAIMEGWCEHTGLQAPAFAAVVPGIISKPLRKLLAAIVRAQAQQPPPGYDLAQAAEVQAVAAAEAANGPAGSEAAASGKQQEQASGAAAAVAAAGAPAAAGAGEGGKQELRSKLQDYVMLNTEGESTQAAPMSLDQLRDQIQDKLREKKVKQAAEERKARKVASEDETDKLRQALRGGKKQQGKQKGGGSKQGSGKGFGG